MAIMAEELFFDSASYAIFKENRSSMVFPILTLDIGVSPTHPE